MCIAGPGGCRFSPERWASIRSAAGRNTAVARPDLQREPDPCLRPALSSMDSQNPTELHLHTHTSCEKIWFKHFVVENIKSVFNEQDIRSLILYLYIL